MTAPDPKRCLEAAHQLLGGNGALGAAAVAGGWWPKACACLVRLALEGAIDSFWQRVSPPVARYGNSRTKLLMLRRRVPREIMRETAYTWAALSRATHHHCYEASVSAMELRQLAIGTSHIIAELSALVGRGNAQA